MLPGKIRGIHIVKFIWGYDPEFLDVVESIVLYCIDFTSVLVVHERLWAVKYDKVA